MSVLPYCYVYNLYLKFHNYVMRNYISTCTCLYICASFKLERKSRIRCSHVQKYFLHVEAWPDATFSLLKFYFIFIDIAIFIDVSFSKDNLEKYMNVI